MKIIVISPDTVPLPLKYTAPEFKIEGEKQFSLKDKCSRATIIGIRAWRIAEQLAKQDSFNVTLLVPDLNYPGKEWIQEDTLKFAIEPYNFRAAQFNWSEELDNKLKRADFVIVQTVTGVAFKNCSVLPRNVNVIVDGLCPMFAEFPCAILGKSSIERKIVWDTFVDQYLGLLLRANCVLYANDRQYYYYEGQFFSINKLGWKAFKFSPLLKVPLGIDIVDKVKKSTSSPKLKLLWHGPIHPWYKPEKILEVVDQLQNTDIDFVNIEHPRLKNVYNRFFKKFFDAHNNSKNIHIIEDYCDNIDDLYKNYDAGIVLARDWLEEKYSIRGRVLAMISRGLPVILNRGNALFNELNYFSDTLYSTSSETIKRDLSRFETIKDSLIVSDRSHKLLQKNLSWAAVTAPLVEYIKRFRLEEDTKESVS